MVGSRRSAVVALLALTVVGCGSEATLSPATSPSVPDTAVATSASTTSTVPESARVICGTQYRPNADSMDGAQEDSLTVEAGALGDPGETVEYQKMALTVTYLLDQYEGDNVNVVVTDAAGERLMSVLYQLGTPPIAEIHFVGDHGFTGLHYVYHQGAGLQFWCRAE